MLKYLIKGILFGLGLGIARLILKHPLISLSLLGTASFFLFLRKGFGNEL